MLLPTSLGNIASQVEVAVVTQAVLVLHDRRTSGAALAAALNAAAMDASLQVICH